MNLQSSTIDIQCFIFDLDGTLVFNEQANFQAYVAAFKSEGLRLAEDDFMPYFRDGGHIKEIYADYCQRHGHAYDEATLERIKHVKIAQYAKHFHLVEQNHATIGLLRALAPHYHTALATTARKENAQQLLEAFGLLELFDYTVYGEDVSAKKPDPECHQKIAAHFGVQPQQCLIFEDSPKGLAAAEAFGGHICKVVR